MAQQTPEVQDPPVMAQQTSEVQDPPVMAQQTSEVQDHPLVAQQTPEVLDPPLVAQPTPEVQDPQLIAQKGQDTLASTSMEERPVRLRKRGWQLTTPYTDPYKPKRARSVAHKFKPNEPVAAEMLAEYVTFKEDPTGRREVDVKVIVDVPWSFNLSPTTLFWKTRYEHLEAYLKIVRKHQRMFPEVYQQNVNIIDPYLYFYMLIWWEQLMPAGTTDKPFLEWPVISYKWTKEQLAWARGNKDDGCRPWKEVDTLLIPMNVGGGHWLMASVELTLRSIRLYDPWQQEVQYKFRNQQVACLRYSLPLMLNQIGFYKKRRGKNTTMSPEPFHMVVVSKHNIPQQKTG
ncbi:hypothetical protein Dsin_008805 [Dipteronia sinensis]|uniref:Ubiquitin-like protease family profile domain-containing protein n=1 Tax=Dipteronia sinensis TaxID=43782 RepID=A0AAE0AQ38_9ROSI|nr:hypothetical protein Dsin_008805 [Dipteronia sinensis]